MFKFHTLVYAASVSIQRKELFRRETNRLFQKETKKKKKEKEEKMSKGENETEDRASKERERKEKQF